MTDPVWWFFLFWLPKYFSETYHLELSGLAMPLVVIYIAADVGSIAGGWISSALLKRGRSLNFARKTAMLICALVRRADGLRLMGSKLMGRRSP